MEAATLRFFMPMQPPTATAQTHAVTVRRGKPVFFDPPGLKDAKAKLAAHLARHAPGEPFTQPVELLAMWCFDSGGRHPDGGWKATRPDTDNLQKALKDAMTKLRFWTDDALVARETCEKRWADTPGILVQVSPLEGGTP
ncbi:MAG: RusA family crossover junction endodeoxyribonuclease [Clostridiales Family XIII bacterium]|jgi:Holliday junction resolvase RusA-like endonuclease|nr:RusA family crossover junction endodeoxyribonuclease [Clostridiales Family XIII bacterium]